MNEERRDPFEQLLRSHRRLEEHLDELDRAARRDAIDAAALRDVADFLARQVSRHEQDEEGSLFPRLAHLAGLKDTIRSLGEQHAAHHALHARLDDVVSALSAGAPLAEVEAELDAVVADLARTYRAHIELEERLLFPAARASLGPADLEAIAAEMQSRRGGGGRRGDRR